MDREETLVLWHYTTGEKLARILRDGKINTTDVYIEPNEKPAAWFSANQVWEESATKSFIDPVKRTIRAATLQEMMTYAGGLARIGVSPHLPGLVGWKKFKRVSGVSRKMARALEREGELQGGDPRDWYASFAAVHMWDWQSVQILDAGCWIDLPHDVHVRMVGSG